VKAKLYYHGRRKSYLGQPVLYIPKLLSDLFSLKGGEEMLVKLQDRKLILKRAEEGGSGYRARVGIVAHRSNLKYFALRLPFELAREIETSLGNEFIVRLETDGREILAVYVPMKEGS
jgi:hypothetical protein